MEFFCGGLFLGMHILGTRPFCLYNNIIVFHINMAQVYNIMIGIYICGLV